MNYYDENGENGEQYWDGVEMTADGQFVNLRQDGDKKKNSKKKVKKEPTKMKESK